MILAYLKEKYQQWQHQRYLKRMGWTEEAYQRRTDPRVFYQAQTVDSFYHGYNYLHIYEDSRGGPFLSRNWTDVYQEIDVWCKTNLRSAWRDDIHRVYEQHAIDANGDTHRELFINDLGPIDVLAYAFDDEQDHLMFVLKWA